jgi:hypothetical protein
MRKKVTIAVIAVVAAYAGVYFYQRHRRRLANEREASEAEALTVINEL